MAWKDPDFENFCNMFRPRMAALRQLSLAEQRAAFDADMEAIPLAEGCTVERIELSGTPAEKISHPDAAPGKTLFYLHGGGYVVGSLKSHRHVVSRLAVAARATAYHLDYRLAPEHPYPAALEDAIKAYRALLRSGIAPENLLVGGESAGGNLAAALLLKAREEDLPQPAGLYLQSPWLDMGTEGASYDTVDDRDPVTSREAMELYAAAFLGGKPDDLFTSPVRADLDGLPPILIQVGTEEVLLSDSLNFTNHAALSGLDVRLDVWPQVPHAWSLFYPFIPAGLPAIDEAGQWMQLRFRRAQFRGA
jgi:monoterpene epsilon-lactone hydrolase